nr:MAG TPA: Commissureless [Caudoviricetes sp.]
MKSSVSTINRVWISLLIMLITLSFLFYRDDA